MASTAVGIAVFKALAPAELLANCSANLFTGPVGTAASYGLVAGAKRIAGFLPGPAAEQNHHILRATHDAYVAAMAKMAGPCMTLALDEEERASAKALLALTREDRFTAFRYDGEQIPLAEVNAAIDRMFGGGIDTLEGTGTVDEHRAFNRAVVADLAVWGVPLTEAQIRLFVEGLDGIHPWHITLRIAFGEALIANEAARTILTQERLGEVRAGTLALIESIAALHGKVESGFAASAERDNHHEAIARETLAAVHALQASQQVGEAPLAMLLGIATTYREALPGSDVESLRSYLIAKAAEYKLLRDRISAFEDEGNHDAALLADAQSALDKGEFDRADALLAESEALIDEKIDRLALAKSERRGLRGDAARLRGDYEGAVTLYDEAAAMLPAAALEQRNRHARSAARTMGDWGERFGEPHALPEAVDRWRGLVEAASRTTDDEYWASLQGSLGNALSTLGERRDDTAALDAAVTAYRDALEVRTRDRLPLDWAATQNNLGNALRTLGARRDDTAALDAAVTAYRDALEVYTRDRLPLDWAMTQENLGIVLKVKARRTANCHTARDAVSAYQSALEIFAHPDLAWNRTKAERGLAAARALVAQLCP